VAVVCGDLRYDLVALAEQAPADATLVIFHTAVLGYVRDTADRRGLARTVRGLGARWIANEPPGLVDTQPPAPPRPDAGARSCSASTPRRSPGQSRTAPG
jgi:hypothetical protein